MVDNNFDPRDGLIIVKFKSNISTCANKLWWWDRSVGYLDKNDYLQHFENCLVEFYTNSTQEERTAFLKFAVELIKADKVITDSENIYLNLIYDRWDFE